MARAECGLDVRSVEELAYAASQSVTAASKTPDQLARDVGVVLALVLADSPSQTVVLGGTLGCALEYSRKALESGLATRVSVRLRRFRSFTLSWAAKVD